MPDLRQTRRNIKIALVVMLGLDVVAAAVLFSPLVGSTESRRQELNQLWSELQTKTREVKPLTNLDQKVKTANQQITEFYQKRFPAKDSQIAAEFGKLAAENGVTIEQATYKVSDEAVSRLLPVEMDANLSGNYVSLAKFINALERDDTIFLIDNLSLGGEQNGPIKLQMKLETYLKAGA
ncbi:MAG: type 4a pilus biogenesis protein PilO [Candidatus Sulfotelmatobacter sp.]